MKSLKLPFVLSLIAIIIACTIHSCSDSNATKAAEKTSFVLPIPTESFTLIEAGFVNIESIRKKEASERTKYYKDNFDLDYLTEEDLQNLCKKNNLHKGPANLYIGDIPDEALSTIVQNYRKLKNAMMVWPTTYTDPHGRIFTQAEVDKMDKRDADWVTGKAPGSIGYKNITPAVMVAAPITQFKLEDGYELSGDNIVKSQALDPIAYVRVSNGYIELARWLN